MQAAQHEGLEGHWRVYFGSVPQTLSYSFRVGFPIAGRSSEAQPAKSHMELVFVVVRVWGYPVLSEAQIRGWRPRGRVRSAINNAFVKGVSI